MHWLQAGVVGMLGALAGACATQVDAPQMTGCPAEVPSAGAPCDAPMSCSFAGDGGSTCGPAFACESFVWQPLGVSCPPPPVSTCPANLPTPGAPCKDPGQACPFDVPGACPGVFVATCTAGEWAVADESPACTPPACPTAEPAAGTACDEGLACSYTVMPPGCGPATENATCVGGAWKIETGPTCSPPPPSP